VRPYLAGFNRGLRGAVVAPGDLTVRMTFLVIVVLVMAALWSAAVEANGGSIEGYTRDSLLWYVMAAQVAVIAVRPRTVEEVGEEIGSGTVAVQMLLPVSVAGIQLPIEAGEAAARLAAALVVGGAATWMLAGPPPSAAGLAMAVPACALGAAANIASQHAFGGIAFWLLDAKSTWFVYQKLVFIPGGMLIPLELLPGGLEAVARVLPFATMAYVPGRLASGHAEPALLAWQAAWLVALVGVALAVYAAGQRRLEVLGG
jgi:viologen exporter family transport system permease protein